MIREKVLLEGGRGYEIVIGPGLLKQIGAMLGQLQVNTSSRHLVITDENVAALHLQKVTSSLAAAGYRAEVYVIPPGESSKSLSMAGAALEYAYQCGLDRRSVVLALGGGVVGDFAGFVAATYMRGIGFVQIPTTLLAHDSAVGGKVAVNLPQAKNIVGAFHQPLGVLYDTDALQTLPVRELRSGLAEAIKHGVIRDRELFFWIEENIAPLLGGDSAALSELLARSCRIKAQVVAADEQEQGLRAILNFGHTLGHAVEWLSAYTHGEAVAIGMVAAAELSVRLGLCPAEEAVRIERAVMAAGLPTRIPCQLEEDELVALMRQDKKTTGGTLTFVLLRRIGDVVIRKDVSEQAVRDVIRGRREG
jgi:3-dehydroquinate synthase